MAKASAPKRAKPKPKLTDKEQSERFKETARALGVDETDSSNFEKVFAATATKRNPDR
jgi:hypothetical protein